MACIGPLPHSSSMRLPRSSRSNMARLQPDTFLPPGARSSDALTLPAIRPADQTDLSSGSRESLSSHSVASPLSLPLSRVTSQTGYFDTKMTNTSSSISYSPLSSGAVRHTPNLQSFLSPQAQPVRSVPGLEHASVQRRHSSLSPPVNRARLDRKTLSAATSPNIHPASMNSGNAYALSIPYSQSQPLPRSSSADASSASAAAQTIRRLTQQNSRIREAWEAERKYMEANRERIEEVYKEERVIMEEERTEWDAEKSAMLQEIQQLQERVAGLESNTVQLQGMVQRLELERAGKVAAVSVAIPGVRPGGDGSTDFPLSLSSASASATDGRHSRGIELAGTALSNFNPLYPSSQSYLFSPGGSRISPSKQPTVTTFVPLDPNMQPMKSPTVDFLASPTSEDVPVVDIQTIHPELEGISVRAPAVQKETFTDSGTDDSKTSSRNPSPPGESGIPLGRRASSKDHTLQVLSAPVTDRLVMHAGHTPNHSLSHLPTAAATETATVAGESTSPTPTFGQTNAAPALSLDIGALGRRTRRIEDSVAFELEASAEDHPEPILEAPAEDIKLKGPLMIRNIPAHDEIFLRRLSEKLEDVSRGQDSTPVCLQDDLDEAAKEPKDKAQAGLENKGAGDASAVTDHDSESESPKDKDVEVDVPLKLKKTTNFGAPLGTAF
ncbi:hypothetical protein BN1708_001912 [Verticillium longisporum]|uniref:Uncharacterized protein n=1 Tax=Verticillium longisporum TaxID=100787 RepID=A0A0G4KDM5_VERLO|nr:hypothetical protein HYQ44_015598 [Verticillium longisporum]CRJ81513.1 hypothetical protein BN1708_001912 [Verticillium longisporum]